MRNYPVLTIDPKNMTTTLKCGCMRNSKEPYHKFEFLLNERDGIFEAECPQCAARLRIHLSVRIPD